MGVHLVYFLNVSSAPDQTNNFLAARLWNFRRRASRVRIDDHHGKLEREYDAPWSN